MKNYFLNIVYTTASLLIGLKLTFIHFLKARKSRSPIGVEDKDYFTQKDGIVTLQYPREEFPVPDNGRYQLHNEIDDCIVCDKCAKVCPVNCIDIEPVRAVEEFGKTSDGTSKKIYAAKFDIDMSKCCFCGLCTTVCPTECLTMTKEYDFSVFDLKEHNFEFGNMTPDLVDEKKKDFEEFSAQKAKDKAAKQASSDEQAEVKTAKPKVGAFKPKVKTAKAETSTESKPKAVFKPKVKPATKEDEPKEVKKTKAVFKPKIKVKPSTETGEKTKSEEVKNIESEAKTEGESTKKKPVFRPKIKPKKKD